MRLEIFYRPRGLETCDDIWYVCAGEESRNDAEEAWFLAKIVDDTLHLVVAERTNVFEIEVICHSQKEGS